MGGHEVETMIALAIGALGGTLVVLILEIRRNNVLERRVDELESTVARMAQRLWARLGENFDR